MGRRYHILDVFTDTRLAGNPLAVVLDSEGLDSAAMQKVAREFNLSETVFCAPPRDPVNTAALRIFTPATELPFAGHPTVGAAILIATLQAPDLIAREEVGLVLEEPIGLVHCSVRHRRGEAAHARFEAPVLAKPWGEPPADDAIAAVLGIAPETIGFATHRPTRFSAGNPMTYVPLATLAAMSEVKLSGAGNGQAAMYYLYTPQPAIGPRTFRTRMLSVGYGLPEDPATGSAAAAFPGVLHANERMPDGEHDCVLLQGIEMGRPSRIGVAFSIEAGHLTTTAVGGSAVLTAEGTLDI
jgi:trans-2,3-dihydro-3-hydroxyanthranilate isomerase